MMEMYIRVKYSGGSENRKNEDQMVGDNGNKMRSQLIS